MTTYDARPTGVHESSSPTAAEVRVLYTPGDWLVVAGPGLWLIADVRAADPVVAECWSLAAAGAALERFTAVLGAGPQPVSFAAARVDPGGVRAIAAGGAEVELTGAFGRTTTVRDDLGAPALDEPIVRLRLAGAALPAETSAALPITGGVVLAANLTAILATTPIDDDPARPATHRVQEPAPATPAEAGPEPSDADGNEGDPARYDAMFGFAALAAAPVEEFPETVAMPPARAEAEPVGHTTMRPIPRQDARADGFMDLDSLGWLAPPDGAPPKPQPVAPTVQPGPPQNAGLAGWPVPPHNAGSSYTPEAVQAAPDELILTTARGGRTSPVPGPTLGAVRCPAGHLDDPAARECRVCGAALAPQAPIPVSRPPLGVLRLSTGDTITLDRNVVLGRAPGAPGGSGAGEPHLVKLPSPYHDISRRHVEIRLDGWAVVAVDLDSRNGTVVEQPGERAVELPRGGACRLRSGAVVGLTEDVSFRFEVTG